MKIGFGFDPFKSDDAIDGKHRFLIRLATQMREDGIIIDNNKPDVHIYLPRGKRNKKAKINLLRVDGLIMNTRWNYKVKNRKIKESIDKSSALIYQGDFCEEAYRRFLGINKRFKIIPNGADPNEFLPRRPKNFFLANSKWRPHKRLEETVKCFLVALEKGLDADLVITGSGDYKFDHKRIKYIGWQKRGELKRLFSKAIASIHLTWLDWCPNSMVEAIVARCPVIYTKCGGQTQLGNGSGIGIEDKQWEFDLIDLYAPPKLNRNEVADAMIYLKENKNKDLYPSRDVLNIVNVAKEYEDYCRLLLKK